MIAYLEGEVLQKTDKQLIVRTQGVGYLVTTTTEVLAMAEVGMSIALYIYTAVREDDISLYGVPTPAALEFFKLLISVSGIGPKSALEILSVNIDQVKNALVEGDTAWLCRLPGIGKKTAERMVLELKSKVGYLPTMSYSGARVNDDVIVALVELGYSRPHIVQVLSTLPSELSATEEILKYCLRNL